MPEFYKEVEKIKPEHILLALKYIAKRGEKGNHGMLYVLKTPLHWAVKHEQKYIGLKDTLRVAYLYAIGDLSKFEDEIFSKNQLLKLGSYGRWDTLKAKSILESKGVRDFHKFEEQEETKDVEMTKLLHQVKQIIFHGPPGTGKTYRAKKGLPELLGVESEDLSELQGERWDIIQFHPSYNYEDFVRGIKVGTTEEGHIKYETANRVFGEMCERASNDNESNKYVLIIDEINRANVSAVLGELIYALEYRGEPVDTPYVIGKSAKLIVPENLYIIGTMNNADRTIGQIDYAVRRRFAFVQCPPDKDVIEKKDGNADEAGSFFDDVKAVFKDISQDFKPDDVLIGHSYFLAKDNKQLAYKILYQVVPILREYVKDGVLLEKAKSVIDGIEERAKKY